MNESNYAGNAGDMSGGQGDAPKSAYRSSDTAPQNFYRSYGGNGQPFTGDRDAATTKTERVSHQEMISRANGGKPGFDMIGTTGDFVGDGQ